ncbi:flexirubin biosynthesis protein [soil metagenome]
MLAAREEIIKYIPQRYPFVAIHEILHATDEFSITQFEVFGESIFVKNGVLSEAGLIENIAQTAAAKMGYSCIKKGIPIPIGYIAGIKNLEVFESPVIGKVLRTSIQVTNRVMDVILVMGEITSEEKVICRCEMRIFVKSSK